MNRWHIFGVVVLITFLAVANLAGGFLGEPIGTAIGILLTCYLAFSLWPVFIEAWFDNDEEE